MTDVAVIGGGINGSMTAYFLQQAGFETVLFEAREIAGGGSGAAGAFLSPKFLKGGELKKLENSALDEAFSFYSEHFPQSISFHPLLHIAKDERDAKNIRYIKEHREIPLMPHNPPIRVTNEYIYTPKSAIVDAVTVCRALIEDVKVYYEDVRNLQQEQSGDWLINGKFRAKKVVLATGAYKLLSGEKHLQGVLRAIWGHRIKVYTTTKNPISLHQFVSISPSNAGVLSIGATHDVHYHPDNKQTYDLQKGRADLLSKAGMTIALENVKILEDFTGLRCGTNDYLPLIGEIVDATKSLQKLSLGDITKKKQDYSLYERHKGLYMINGSAGYGFVLAPYLAKTLCNHIRNGDAIVQELDVARFFPRYIRRNGV